jgi:hypothetical protein
LVGTVSHQNSRQRCRPPGQLRLNPVHLKQNQHRLKKYQLKNRKNQQKLKKRRKTMMILIPSPMTTMMMQKQKKR